MASELEGSGIGEVRPSPLELRRSARADVLESFIAFSVCL